MFHCYKNHNHIKLLFMFYVPHDFASIEEKRSNRFFNQILEANPLSNLFQLR